MEPKAKYQNLRISDELLEDFKGRILSTMETQSAISGHKFLIAEALGTDSDTTTPIVTHL